MDRAINNAGGPAVVTLVDDMDVGESFGCLCQVAFGEAVAGFVEVIVEVGDGSRR